MEVRHRDRFAPSADAVAAAAAVVGLVGAGLTETGVFGLGLGLIVIAAALWWKGEEVADRLDVGPAVDVTERRRPGMSEKRVQEYYHLHQTYLAIQKEKRDDITDDLETRDRTLNRQ